MTAGAGAGEHDSYKWEDAMMGRVSRAEEFQASEVGIVHVVQRCVRRAGLARMDDKTGQDYSYRREWIRRWMESLVSVFAIDVLTFAIMSNHMHLILRNRPDVDRLSIDCRSIVDRWMAPISDSV